MRAKPGVPGESSTAANLPGEVLLNLLQHVGLRTLVNVRNASSILGEPASLLVTELMAADGILPPHAWTVFPNATKLQVDDHGSKSDTFMSCLLHLLKSVPTRLEAVRILSIWKDYFRLVPMSKYIADGLVAAACRVALHHVELHMTISTAAADTILQGLPNLRDLLFSVDASPYSATMRSSPLSPGRWCPAPASSRQLTQLTVGCVPGLTVDFSGLSSVTSLRNLALIPSNHSSNHSQAHIDNLRAISNLTRLTELTISCTEDFGQSVTNFDQLRELQILTLPWAEAHEAGWQILALLPKLHTVSLHRICIDSQTTPATSLTRLTGGDKGADFVLLLDNDDDDDDDDDDVPGCLTRLLPNLQDLTLENQSGFDVVITALQGHTALTRLRAEFDYFYIEEDVEWGQHCLSALPALQVLEVVGIRRDASAVFADICGCSKLTSLVFDVRTYKGELPVAMLASGLSGRSLKEVRISVGQGLQPAAVAELLRGGDRMIEKVVVGVQRPGQSLSQVRMKEMLPVVLRWHGASDLYSLVGVDDGYGCGVGCTFQLEVI